MALLWYEKERAGLGLDFYTEFEETLNRICSDPFGGSPHTHPPYRYRTLDRFPYSVYYEPMTDHVWVAAVVHHSRREGYGEQRMPGDP